MALRQDGFTTKGNSQVTEDAGRGDARGEGEGGRRDNPIVDTLEVTTRSSEHVDVLGRIWSASKDVEGFSITGARLKAGFEGLRRTETFSASWNDLIRGIEYDVGN